MLNEALEEARIEASKLASHLERKLDSVLNITVSKNSNEQGQNEAGSWNINKSIGWTAYPPLSALDMNGNTVANEMSIFVRKEYEISFNTINLD